MKPGTGENGAVDGAMRALTITLNIVVAVAMFGLMAVTFADVVGRYFFSSPLNGSVDIIQMMMGILIFSALPLVSVRQEHITVDLLDRMFSVRARRLRQIVVTGITAAVLAFIGLRMFDSAQYMRANRQLGFILDVPLAPVVYAMSALSFLAFVLMVRLFVANLRRPSRPGVDEA